jgi:hypothetical protein
VVSGRKTRNIEPKKKFLKQPAADRSEAGFFMPGSDRTRQTKDQTMTIIGKEGVLSAEERLAALAHIYLELRLPLHEAFLAARADLEHLDAPEVVAEAA